MDYDSEPIVTGDVTEIDPLLMDLWTPANELADLDFSNLDPEIERADIEFDSVIDRLSTGPALISPETAVICNSTPDFTEVDCTSTDSEPVIPFRRPGRPRLNLTEVERRQKVKQQRRKWRESHKRHKALLLEE